MFLKSFLFILLCFSQVLNAQNIYKNDFELFCKSYHADLEKSLFLYQSIEKHDKSKNPFFMILPKKDLALFKKSFTKLLDDKKIVKLPNFLTEEYVLDKCGILSKIENGQTIDEKLINTMYLAYKKLVESIKMKYPDAKIVLFDIYYPNNLKYKQFHKYIQEWNKKIYDYTREKNYELFKISSILTKPEDFTFDIEPSSIGSRKVVNAILSIY